MTEFKIGDVVVLKSGLNRMTVTGEAIGYEYKHAYPCVWMEGNGPKHEWFYESDTLTLLEHAKKQPYSKKFLKKLELMSKLMTLKKGRTRNGFAFSIEHSKS